MPRRKGKAITLLGAPFELIFCSLKRVRMPGYKQVWGLCDPPEANPRRIRIEETLDDAKRMEMLIHESIHGGNWHLDEDSFVAPLAFDIAKILIEDGYRRRDGSH